MTFLYEELTRKILDACFELSNELGAGFLEIEIKATSGLVSDHKAQVINYLKASYIDVGLLVNFGKPKLEYHRLHK